MSNITCEGCYVKTVIMVLVLVR